ncbi:putative nonspecific lipid-transfer protein [Microbacterium sp. HM58-2]|nr:putative nonspecific lipid-transfer protein [Microbacterium sp. HM58-2]
MNKQSPRVRTRASMHRAVIAGVGETDYSRESGRSTMHLAVEAIKHACRDAGILPEAIDGVITHPHSISAEEIMSTLGLKQMTFNSTIHMGGAGAVASLKHAALAVESGTADHVLVIRSRNGASGGRINQRPPQQPAQQFRSELEVPYGWNTPAQRYSMICRRYMHEYGLTREQLGAVAVSASRYAQRNPRAQNHGRPLTMEKYLAGRVIADPYTRYDCCLETDGACAIIISRAEDAPSRAVQARIAGVGEGRPTSPDDLTNRTDLLEIGLDHAAPIAWESAGVGPEDMDAAMVYDCFTFEVIHQLEAAGFVARGEAGRFCASGEIDFTGRLPVNTHGGLLAEGHLSGLSHVIEGVRQIRGEAGAWQLESVHHVAVTGWGDLGDGALAVLEGVRGVR